MINQSNKEAFENEAEKLVADKLRALQALTYDDATKLPNAVPEDIVIAGKEVQITVFRQSDIEALPGVVLVTLQVVRAGLGGILNYHFERGLVYSATDGVREATESELLATG